MCHHTNPSALSTFVHGCFACMSVYHMWMPGALDPLRLELPGGCWASNPGMLEKQPVTLTVEPSLQPLELYFLISNIPADWFPERDENCKTVVRILQLLHL